MNKIFGKLHDQWILPRNIRFIIFIISLIVGMFLSLIFLLFLPLLLMLLLFPLGLLLMSGTVFLVGLLMFKLAKLSYKTLVDKIPVTQLKLKGKWKKAYKNQIKKTTLF